MSGLLRKTPETNKVMTIIANKSVNFEKEWDVMKRMVRNKSFLLPNLGLSFLLPKFHFSF